MTTPANPRSNNPNWYDVPTNAAQNQHFPNQSPISVELASSTGNYYSVYRKDIPDNVIGQKYPANGKVVTWINNFGLNAKSNANPPSGNRPSYTVHIPRVAAATTYVYYDGSQVQPLNASANPNDSNDIVATGLTLVDPPIGWI